MSSPTEPFHIRKYLIIILIYILSIGSFSCKNREKYKKDTPNKSNISVFDLNLNRYIEREFKLSETCDSTEYVVLETSESNYIGRIKVIKISSNYIILTDDITRKVHVFNRAGEYLFEMGKQGKGPGEYIQVDDLLIDEDNHCVLLKSGKGVLKYSLDNQYLEYVKFEVFPRFITANENGFVSIILGPSTIAYKGYTFNFLDENGKLVGQKVRHDLTDFTGEEPIAFKSLYNTSDTLCLWEAYFDTIYGLTNEGQIIPRWTFNYGQHQITKQDLRNLLSPDRSREPYFCMRSFYETPKHIFVQAHNLGRPANLLLDKENNEYIIPVSENEYGAGQIINDLDKIINYWPSFYPASNTTLMEIEPVFFKKAFGQSEQNPIKRRISHKYSQQIQSLNQFSNPVLCIINHK